MRARRGGLSLAIGSLWLLIAVPAVADPDPCDGQVLNCQADTDAAYANLMDRDSVLGLPSFPGDKKGPVKRDPKAPRYEYVSLPDCDQNRPDNGSEVMCSKAIKQCPPDMVGHTRLRIWQRLVDPPADPEPWRPIGVTCWDDVAPGAKPRLTMAMINAAAMRTPWAEPVITTQPKGDVTLVNLKTFYKVTWSADGFEPGEVDTKVLAGVPVKIRPKLAEEAAIVYDFGDGERFGPTPSLGGVWPDGDVTHTFTKRGVFTSRAVVTWTAEFSIDGGATWDDITATVEVPGPVTPVTVKEKRAVLVNN